MPKAKALKVFRTPIGFHDAYVATSTKKAALEAWGSHRNLFAIGEAEQVTDPKLIRAPLASPGKVIKVLRGTAAEQLRALPPNEQHKAKKLKPEPKRATTPKPPPRKKLVPRPSRTKLERVEVTLAKLLAANAKELEVIDSKIDELQKERAAIAERHSARVSARQSAVDRAQADYHDELSRWRSRS